MQILKIVIGLLSLLIAFSLIAFTINLVEADPVRWIIIQSDGSIVPQTEYIKKEGNVYYLTQNLSPFRFIINCSNIVLDGQGYTVDGSNYFVLGGTTGIELDDVSNVTIRDIIVVGFCAPSISLSNCTNVTILRVQTDAKPPLTVDISGCVWLENSNQNKIYDCDTGVRVQSGSNNIIFRNTVTLLINSANNLVYYNNINVYYYGKNHQSDPIVGLGALTNRWDNGSVGNYWSDYAGQGAYVLNENNTDYHPLKQPVTIQPILTPTPTPTVPELSWLTSSPLLLFTLSVALAVRHRRHSLVKKA